MNLSCYFRPSAVLCGVLITLMPHPVHGQTTELRWKFAPGNQFDVSIRQTTDLETEVDLVKQTVQTESAVRFGWSVKDVDRNGIAAVEMTIRSVRLKVVMPLTTGMRTLEVNTDVPVDGESAMQAEVRQNLQAIVGAPMNVRIDGRGQLLEITLTDETKAALRQAPQSMQIRQLVSEEGLQELLGSAAPALPEEEVALDSFWNVEREVSNPAGRFRRMQSMIWADNEQKDNREQARIQVAASLEPIAATDDPARGNTEAVRLTIREQQSRGNLWFDMERGMFTGGTIHSSLVTTAPYREKQIITRVNSEVDFTIEKSE